MSVFPVGLVGTAYSTSPVLNSEGKVSDFIATWHGKRTFVVDMAEFAVNVGFYRKVRRKICIQEHNLTCEKSAIWFCADSDAFQAIL